MRTLKSLAEIAFDGFQTFAEPSKRYESWKTLTPVERDVFERIATRVHAEVVLRQADGLLPIPTNDSEAGQSLGEPPEGVL